MRNTLLFHVWAPNIYQFNHLFDNNSDGDIKGFVFQRNSEVYKFIGAVVDLFD